MNKIFVIGRHAAIINGIMGHLIVLCNNLRIGNLIARLNRAATIIGALCARPLIDLSSDINLFVLAMISLCLTTTILTLTLSTLALALTLSVLSLTPILALILTFLLSLASLILRGTIGII